MTLTWIRTDRLDHFTATGLRGTYWIQRVGMRWWLGAQGHDQLPMLTLPAGGLMHTSREVAMGRADEIETEPAIGELSGC